MAIFKGVSGQSYNFRPYPAFDPKPNIAGVYAFMVPRARGLLATLYQPPASNTLAGAFAAYANAAEEDAEFVPIYFGQTNGFGGRVFSDLKNHEHYPAAKARGLSHIGLLHVSRKEERDRIESDLIANYPNLLNIKG